MYSIFRIIGIKHCVANYFIDISNFFIISEICVPGDLKLICQVLILSDEWGKMYYINQGVSNLFSSPAQLMVAIHFN